MQVPIEKASEQTKTGQQCSEQFNLIELTRLSIKQMSEKERFERAKCHIANALRYKQPRIELSSEDSFPHLIYKIQTSLLWESMLRVISFIYMYIILFNSTSIWYRAIALSIMSLFAIDLLIKIYHQSYDLSKRKSRFSLTFFLKVTIIMCLIADEMLTVTEVTLSDGRMLHPFRVLRASKCMVILVLPILYDSEIKRSFESLTSAYKDIFVYFIFYSFVVVFFAIICNLIIQENDWYIGSDGTMSPIIYDEYRNNYGSLEKMIFIMYTLGTYDAYPDNQIPAIQNNIYIYLFFIVYVFLNMFLFSSIPGSLIFDRYRETRSKLILIDQIKMQHSLVIAFVSLGEESYSIHLKKVISFLHYFYSYRPRYIDSITEICLKLNPNDSNIIRVNQFMQIGRILQENSSLKPAYFEDISWWINFRKWINNNLKLKQIITSKAYQIFFSLIIFSAFINAILCLYVNQNTSSAFSKIDLAFTYIFLVEAIIQIIAIGPENYFNTSWSLLSSTIVVFGVIFKIALPTVQPSDSLFRLFRIFEASYLITLFEDLIFALTDFKIVIFQRIVKLCSRVMGIVPLILRFLPLFGVVYYILGIIGMELFYQDGPEVGTNYETYREFSNFHEFIYTQFYFVQVLTEGGWSTVALDITKERQNMFFIVMLFFVCCHIMIVLVMAALIKGIFWSIFFTVNEQYQEKYQQQKNQQQIIKKNQQKIKQCQLLAVALDKNVSFSQKMNFDTLIKRQLYQQAANEEILKRIKLKNKQKKLSRPSIKETSGNNLYRNFDVNKTILESEEAKKLKAETEIAEAQKYIFNIINKFSTHNFQLKKLSEMEEVGEHDLQEKICNLSTSLKLKNKEQYEFQIANNAFFLKHLKDKLLTPLSKKNIIKSQENNLDELTSKQSLNCHILTLQYLLNMKPSRREQKAVVLQSLLEAGKIEQKKVNELISKKLIEKSFNIDENCTVRRMYLQDTKPNLIQKFEAEYFGDIYGNAFKQINKITLEPMIRLQSEIIYALKNILRYPSISSLEFFKILSKVEEEVSNKLLRNGSLCKFVFQLNCDKEIWFSLYLDHSNKIKFRFIKNGIWIYNQDIKEQEIYYGKDIFKYQRSDESNAKKLELKPKRESKQIDSSSHNSFVDKESSRLQSPKMDYENLMLKTSTMKKLFQTFQSLAFSMKNRQNFFQSNPTYHKYDLFFEYIDVSSIQRLIPKELQIEKIMIVLLTKEDERSQEDMIPFEISDIQTQPPIDQINFTLDQREEETFEKLTKLSELNDEEMTAKEGLPFRYVLNFLCEINDVLKLYSPNFIHQVETVINEEIKRK